MKKRLLAAVLAIALTVLPIMGTGVSAKGSGLNSYIEVTGYDPKADYMTLMLRALKNGGTYAMQVGAIYEQQRNMKIDDKKLPYQKTSYFTDYTTAKEILAAIEAAKKPKPSYTEEDLDLLARIINAEAGCDWIPDWVQRMVGSVVLNRVKSKHFPNTIREVIYQPGQYGPVYNGMIHYTPTKKSIENARYVLEQGST